MNRFAFGENWYKFLNHHFSSEVLTASRLKLSSFLKLESLEGKTFVDFGSGSGLHSLAALELGAMEVVSIDIDQIAVKCAGSLKSNSPYKSNWIIKEGSLLDKQLVSKLGQFDIVYCWGVAHHTGNMWNALDNISSNVKEGGLLFLAIYNHVEGRRGSRMWWQIKHVYNHSPLVIRKVMESVYISYHFIFLVLHLKNPFSVMESYKAKRGMAWITDLIDWLGGYPYEYATVKEIFDFYDKKGFILKNIQTTNHIGCNQFLFMKKNER